MTGDGLGAREAGVEGSEVGGDGAGAPLVAVVGDVIDDIVVRPLAPVAHATDTPARITPTPGGSGANQAAWLARAGARVRFAGRVGAAGLDRHRRALAAAGVEPWLAADPDRATGTIVVVVDDAGERSMFTDRGANLGLVADDLPDRLLDGVDALHVSGYGLFDASVRAAVLDLVGRARGRGVRVAVDPASVGFLRVAGGDAFLDWIGEVDVLLPNVDEARLLTGRHDPAEAADALLSHAAVVAVTCGADGATVVGRRVPPTTVPAPRVEVVDTTGAGDAFAGAFLAAWLAGADPARAVERGVAAAAEAVTVTGGRPPVEG